jgi:hypothetical protein
MPSFCGGSTCDRIGSLCAERVAAPDSPERS